MKPIPFTLCAVLFTSCASSHYETHLTSSPLGSIRSLNDYVADVQVEPKRVTGKSSGGTFLFFDTGDDDYADYLIYDGQRLGILDLVLGTSRLEELKRAAVHNACQGAKCDVLAYPMFHWKESSTWFGSQYTVIVTGFPGYVQGIKTVPRTIVPGVLHLGPDESIVPPENRYRVESSEGSVIQLEVR